MSNVDTETLLADITDMKRDFGVEKDEELANILIHPMMHPNFRAIEEAPYNPQKPPFTEDLTYQRLNWSIEFISRKPYDGRLPAEDFDYLADVLQTGTEFVTQLVFPVLAYLGLLEVKKDSVSLTDKAYEIIRRKL